MFKIPLAVLREKIVGSGKLTAPQLEQRVKDKINELSGLVSEEGAMNIIANELGIELLPPQREKLKVKEIYPGMRNVSLLGKVVQKYETRTFAKGDKKGKVCSVIVGDETGTLRLVFWNDQVSVAESLQENDVVLVTNGYVKESTNNGKEVHLGEKVEVRVNPEGQEVATVRRSANFERRKIQELQGNDTTAEIMGTIVQVFDPRFFSVCPQCGKRVTESNGQAQCGEHGVVGAQWSCVLNAVVDDGTGNIRGVFWKNQTLNLLGKSEQEVAVYKDNLPSFENMKTDLLGEQVKLTGRVRNNEMFGRLEFNVQTVERASPEEELARLQKAA